MSKYTGYTPEQGKRQAASDKKNTKGYYLKLTYSTDGDIIDKLDTVDNRQNYIKDLIRKDIEK